MLAQGLPASAGTARDGERRRDELAVFVQSFAPPPRMLVFGAIDFAAAVARNGKFLGLPGHGVRRPARCSRPGPGSPTRTR